MNLYLTSGAVRLKADGTPKQTSTVNRTKSVLKAFFRWCEKAGWLKKNPTAQVRLAPTLNHTTRYMTRREVRRFLRTIRQGCHPLAARDHALFATLACTGIRLSDVVGLAVTDVNLQNRELLLRRTKGGQRDMRHIPDQLVPPLSTYLRTRRRTSSPGGAAFPGQNGAPLSVRQVQYRFAYWLDQAGIDKPLSVHSLRHTFGTLLYQATKDILLVSHALGHRDLKSTQRYAHLDNQGLVRAINRML